MNKAVKQAFLFLGGDAVLRCRNRVPRVLFWHGVDQRCNPEVEQEIYDVEVFKQQIGYLRKHYEIISVEEFERRFNEKKFSGREVVLTFDDGYANNLNVVLPILKQFGLPFTVFVSVEHVEKGLYFPTSVNRIIVHGSGLKKVTIPSRQLTFDLHSKEERHTVADQISNLLKTLPVDQVKTITEDLIQNVTSEKWESLKEKYQSVRPMTWDEVKRLSDAKVTIGSHCMWHICCHQAQPETEVKYQLEESKKQLEQHIGKECRYFAYPNGDYTDFSNACVRSNYALGFSTQGAISVIDCKDPAVVPRISVVGSTNTFRIMTNLYPNR